MTATTTPATRRTRSAKTQPPASETMPQALPTGEQSASVARSALKGALADVSKALAGKSTLPVLSHVLIFAEEGEISLTATDLTIAITRSVEARVTGSWRVTAPGKLLADVVGALPEGAITLTYLDSQHAITKLRV
jgi:DNA polymerase III sliding clamp (beta) subunit (PCNA family)